MVDVNRMTHKVQEALQQAGGIATRRGHQGIDVEHLLQALLAQPDGLALPPHVVQTGVRHTSHDESPAEPTGRRRRS